MGDCYDYYPQIRSTEGILPLPEETQPCPELMTLRLTNEKKQREKEHTLSTERVWKKLKDQLVHER